MRRSLVVPATLALFVTLAAATVRADEVPVTTDKIPRAVMDALLAKFPRAKIDKCVKEKEGNDVIYDIEFKQDGRNCEADIKENGTYLNYEKAIQATQLPQVVRDAIARKYPNSTMKEIMEETAVNGSDEKLSAYEVVLATAEKKQVEVRVSPAGKILEDTGAK
jgi:hypothetical protein